MGGRPRSFAAIPSISRFSQATGADPAGERLAHRHLARRHQCLAHLALRRRPRPTGAPRLLAIRAAARGMVPHRVAGGRERAHKILALNPAGGYAARRPRRPGQAALAHRAGLSGAQAGDRPRSLRRSRVARIPSPRRAGDRSLRIPGFRAEPDSPLRATPQAAPQSASATRRLSTPRRRRPAPNATSPIPSPPSTLNWQAPSHDGSHDVPVANCIL
jgi:hypothetical protein